MKANRHSRTAEAAAALRGLHRLIDDPVILDDPYAAGFAGPRWQALLDRPLLRQAVARDPSGLAGVIRGHVVGRARFAEDHLAAALEQGLRQYLMVGAGLDSYALRMAESMPVDLTLFELDHPATQREKQARIQALGPWPAGLTLIPIDFETQELARVLADSAIDPDAPIFCSWLGTTPYLTASAIFATLKTLAEFAPSGSRLAMDFATAHRAIARGRGALQGAALLTYTRWVGEPLQDHGLNLTEFLDACREAGWRPQEVISAREVAQRYFAHSRPRLGCIQGTYFGYFERD